MKSVRPNSLPLSYFLPSLFTCSLIVAVVTASGFVAPPTALAQNKEGESAYTPPVDLGHEYEEYAVGEKGKKSSKGKSSKGTSASGSDHSTGVTILLYLPNRFLDLLDVFRVDVGGGPAYGGVIRLTKWGQLGYREMSPLSARVGLRGRKSPVFIEKSNEVGIGPGFLQSKDREVTPVEIGAGLDLGIVGAYLGVSVDELVDFGAGIVGIDLKDDDL